MEQTIIERSNWDQQAKAGFIGTFCTRDPLVLAVVLAKSKMIPPETRRVKEIWVGFIIITPPANPNGVLMCVWDAKGNEISGRREWDLMRRVNE